MTDASQIYEAALQLPDKERALLIARLLESFDGESDTDASATWSQEINRRLSALDNGDVSPIPWSDAREMILGNLDGPPAG